MRYPGVEGHGRSRADLVAVVILLAVGGLVSTLDPGRQLDIASAIRSSILRPFLALHDVMAERARLAARAAELRSERDSLAAEVVRLEALAEEGRQLRRLADLPLAAPEAFVTADIRAGRPRIGDSHVFLLRGRGLGGVHPPAGVLTGRGLVGVMRESEDDVGRGQFWTHRDFRVSVRTDDGGASGIVEPVALEGELVGMVLRGAPYQQEIRRGTALVTSGVAGIYPPGIRVGTVDSVRSVQSGWARSYFVQPAVRPEQVEAALVWRRMPLEGPEPAASGAPGGGPEVGGDSGGAGEAAGPPPGVSGAPPPGEEGVGDPSTGGTGIDALRDRG